MAFDPSKTSSISGSSDAALSAVADRQTLTYDSASSKWTNKTNATSNAGRIYFDDFFAGATDNEKIGQMNAWAASQSANGPAIVFGARQYSFSTPIALHSGLKLISGTMSNARTYGRSTVFNWGGGVGTSLFTFPGGTTPQDISVAYIQMQGGAATHCLPKLNPANAIADSSTLTHSQFHACGFKGFNTVWWGKGKGSSISGQTYFEGIADTALHLGGDSNMIFGKDAISRVLPGAASTVFLRSRMSSSHIGNVILSASGGSAMVSIEAGTGLVLDGVLFEGPSAAPLNGAGLIVKGGSNVTVTHCSFKCLATNASAGWGGAADNKGWIHVGAGAGQISVMNSTFIREGSAPAATYPLLYVASGAPANAVKWGFNAYVNFPSTATIRQAETGRIATYTDPTVTIATGV